MAQFVIAGIFILVVACGVGLGVASADSSDELARAGAFGFDEATQATALSVASAGPGVAQADTGSSGQQALASTSARDITTGLVMIEEREAAERERVEADNKAVFNRVESERAMQGVEADDSADSPAAEAGQEVQKDSREEKIDEYNLPAVDWSVGKVAFIEEWTDRIDAYLASTPLAGYGSVFAEAAWNNGIDPRWSPAISNTESGNGAHCFLPHNAWGWGDDAWPDWETAINAHVSGLAEVYGYSVTYAAAQKYCPPNSVHWYNNTLSQMGLI